jgi:hydrogenase maturation protease
MNRQLADKIAKATLYEGYILYPYRPSVKNQQRWTFGGIYPQSWSESKNSSDPCTMQTEVLVAGTGNISLQVIIRFLHLVDRTVGKTEFQIVESLEVDGTRYRPWQEAVEREVDAGEFDVNDLVGKAARVKFDFPAERTIEPVKSADGELAGVLIRQRYAIEGVIEICAVEKADDLRKISIKVLNRTNLDNPQSSSRDDALMRSLVSMHVLLGVREGEFVSPTDMPDKWRAWTAECHNTGLWPVLIGTGGEHDTMLASPIILYDYPQLAPESPGELFDSTEIDEILTLRILTLTDDEKREAASIDPRARDLLARSESLAREQLINLHGTIRGLRPAPMAQEQSTG